VNAKVLSEERPQVDQQVQPVVVVGHGLRSEQWAVSSEQWTEKTEEKSRRSTQKNADQTEGRFSTG
jgi:hypothetical protein